MNFYKTTELINFADNSIKTFSGKSIFDTDTIKASKILSESTRTFSAYKTYDIFLSHSIKDSRIILGLKADLERRGLSVYVDWVEDIQLDRSKVNRETADLIRTRINSCKSLFYALSKDSKLSSWVQWELGYADGNKNGKVAILPIDDPNHYDNSFYKQEYLGLYPVVDHSDEYLWINRDGGGYCNFDKWVRGKKV